MRRKAPSRLPGNKLTPVYPSVNKANQDHVVLRTAVNLQTPYTERRTTFCQWSISEPLYFLRLGSVYFCLGLALDNIYKLNLDSSGGFEFVQEKALKDSDSSHRNPCPTLNDHLLLDHRRLPVLLGWQMAWPTSGRCRH